MWESFSPPLFPPRVCALPPALPNRYYKEERAIFGALRPWLIEGSPPRLSFNTHIYVMHEGSFYKPESRWRGGGEKRALTL